MGGNREGVKILVKQYKEQLERIMLLTGCEGINSINDSMIIYPDFKNNNYFKKNGNNIHMIF